MLLLEALGDVYDLVLLSLNLRMVHRVRCVLAGGRRHLAGREQRERLVGPENFKCNLTHRVTACMCSRL